LLSTLCLAQEATGDEPEREPPKVELLTMSGSKPNLSPAGEGITSIKITDLFQRGVTVIKPFDGNFAYQLPAGYTLFNKLAYEISSEAVFSGPNDFVFHLPSATTKEVFGKLRILIAERDSAEPAKPRWTDVTLRPELPSYLVDSLTKADFEKRLPNYETRTVHAFMEHSSSLMVVALKDTAAARDQFVADISVTGDAPEQVMEGRHVTYDLKVSNNGPDTATGVYLHAQPTFEFVSVSASEGQCRMEASNVHCKFASLSKGKSVSVKIIEQCRWGSYSPNFPGAGDNKYIQVESAELDPDFENNSLYLMTAVTEDTNKAPVAEIISPKEDELFAGPEATVTIVAKASDPDGFINKIEFFDQGIPIGEGTLSAAGEYQLVYKKVALGRHWLEVNLTDNLGREERHRYRDFFVNGAANVEITKPKMGSLQDRVEGEMSFAIHASHPNLKLKEVELYLPSETFSGFKALPVGDDLYVAKFDCSSCKRTVRLMASVVDDSGVETRSAPVSFKLRKPPVLSLNTYDGEDTHRLVDGQVIDLSTDSTLYAGVEDTMIEELNTVKLEFFANGKLVYTYVASGPKDIEDRYIDWDVAGLEPGRYKVQAVATDGDGSIGKSALVEIEIKKKQ
jgi:uncharacterized repeat protein (TIGR01451 family)